VLACSFHPELADDPRMHALLMAIASEVGARAGASGEGER
jgi:glutamine amidotransferase PdxT